MQKKICFCLASRLKMEWFIRETKTWPFYLDRYLEHLLNIWLMPCPFTGCKIFCAGQNFLTQPKHLTAFSASSKTFVPAQKLILVNANHLLVWHKMFVTGTMCKWIFSLTQKIWTGSKHFATCKRTRHKSKWML